MIQSLIQYKRGFVILNNNKHQMTRNLSQPRHFGENILGLLWDQTERADLQHSLYLSFAFLPSFVTLEDGFDLNKSFVILFTRNNLLGR